MTTSSNNNIRVDLGPRSYDIRIGSGLIDHVAEMLKEIAPGACCAIVTDSNVNEIYGANLRAQLDAAKIENITIEIAPGEASKCMEVYAHVVDQLLAQRLERTDVLIALGGGVVGDLAGFAAASMRRGMKFLQIPTSLLAQVDSSVGGKTGINSPHGKNLIGAFHQPILVVADTEILKTLSKREFTAGYAEVAKYGLIDRPEFFEWLEKNHEGVFNYGDALAKAVSISCQAKAEVVAADEQERGQRALLNLGHTFGHALEGATKYDSARLVHGEGVAIGTVLAHQFSNRMNLCSADCTDRVIRHFKEVGLPTSLADIPGNLPNAQALMDYITQDKKVVKGSLTFILTKGIGQSFIANDVPPAEVLSFLEEKLQ